MSRAPAPGRGRFTVRRRDDRFVLDEDGRERAIFNAEPTQEEAKKRVALVLLDLEGPEAALRFLLSGHVTFRQTNG